MEYRRLGSSGLKVPALTLGAGTFGGQGPLFGAWGNTDVKEASRLIDICLDAGAAMFDTADVYSNGASEEVLGGAIKGRRDKVILSTKATFRHGAGPNDVGSSRHHLIEACEGSLRRLGTDHIDLYQLHGFDALTPVDEALRALDDLVRAGKVRYIGASNYPAWRLMEALWQSDRNGFERFISYQPQYSLMERAGFEVEAMPLCRHHGLGVMPYSPLACGFLTGKYRRGVNIESVRAEEVRALYANERGFALIDRLEEIGRAHGKTVAQTALAWLLTNSVVTSPIVGANTAAQLQESLGAAGYRLDAAERESLDALSAYPRNWRPIWD